MSLLLHERVKKVGEEIEPLGLLDFTITIGIEAGDELIYLRFTND